MSPLHGAGEAIPVCSFGPLHFGSVVEKLESPVACD